MRHLVHLLRQVWSFLSRSWHPFILGQNPPAKKPELADTPECSMSPLWAVAPPPPAVRFFARLRVCGLRSSSARNFRAKKFAAIVSTQLPGQSCGASSSLNGCATSHMENWLVLISSASQDS